MHFYFKDKSKTLLCYYTQGELKRGPWFFCDLKDCFIKIRGKTESHNG